MRVLTLLCCFLLLWCQVTSGSAVLTQSPGFLSATPAESFSIICRASESISDYVTWYQQKPGQPCRILIYDADNQYSGVSDHYTGIQSGTEFIFKISRVEASDAGTYFCQQDHSGPLTVLQPRAQTIPQGWLCRRVCDFSSCHLSCGTFTTTESVMGGRVRAAGLSGKGYKLF
ncbi:Ig kappa chain V-II region RPMI 6410 [Fukomys damarensis]|uniref:Ig kappa chain V-II region RPMI 6410 n=1 Tax=Fukomys damarensis TaxID=885580 RepID=A0A091D908_FUKDA|nr:Ig kappa chain V-II region RPMI 6410 [Fukomys damarensis]